jgi:TolB protein
MNLIRLKHCISLLLWTIPILGFTQFKVDVSGIGLSQIPYAIATFRGEELSPQKPSLIISADLERSGLFKSTQLTQNLDELSRPDISEFRQKKVDALILGSVDKLADGKFDVRFRLWDVVRGVDLGSEGFTVMPSDLRLVSHKIADYVFEKLTGERGVFSTRIAYVTKNSNKYSLWVADSDGENAQAALTSPEPIISPRWSPSGKELAYVSFELRKPVVYVHDVSTGMRRIIANFKGSNSAPTWSPDGKTIAVTLSRDGGSQLFLLDANGGTPKRLTESSSIDTEPMYSPDGSYIYFVSDRGGLPQIYKISSQGGLVDRVTYTGSYNISPSISADGRLMAYISRISGEFKLHVMDLKSEKVSSITSTSSDERPSFAPNSKYIIYATRVNRKEALLTTSVDGKISSILQGESGDIREPNWGPFR